MKIILISPPGNVEKTLGKLKKLSTPMQPMGIAYTAANLRKNGFDVEIIDSFAENLDITQTIELVKNKNPDIVRLSMLTPGAPIAHKVAKGIKEFNPNIKIITGGAHAALLPKETLSDKDIDFVVRSEGEIAIIEIVKAIGNNQGFENIKNISYRKDNEIINNPDGNYIQNLDELPFPAWDLLKLKLYGPPPHWDLKKPCFPIMASRGCPYRCTFCSLKTMGKQYRKRSPNNIVDEIEWLVNKFGAKEIMFMDAAFPLDKEWGINVCNEIIKRDLNKKIVWLCETRVNHTDLELLKKMRQAGCRRIAFGIESGVQELLNNIKKGFKLEDVREAIKIAKKAKLEVIAYFMLGLPGETKELSLKTIEFAKELDADFVKFNLTVPYPGTEMYDQAVKDGTLKSMDWEIYTSFSAMTDFDPVYIPKGMTKEELMNIQKFAIKSYYFRPKAIIKQIYKIRSFKDISRDFNTFLSLMQGITNKKKSQTENILVTGGAGFIGSHLCEALLKKGNKVICIDNFNSYYDPKKKEKNIEQASKNKNFTLHRIDITNKDELRNVFQKGKIDKIAHLAARAGVRASFENKELYESVNITGTRNLLELAKDFKVKNFVFGSSSSVYGANKKIPFSEEDPTEDQISPYAKTKKAAELFCKEYHDKFNLNITCLRFFTVYGPRGRPDMAPYKFTKLILEEKPIEMYGQGTSKRDYTYVKDVVDAILLTLEKKLKFEIINIGNSKPIDLNHFISLIEKNTGKKAQIQKLPMQKGDVEITYADISKAKRLLNYDPKVPIEKGIELFVKWFKERCT